MHGVLLVVPGMFDSDASSMKVAFFHRSSAPAASCAEIVLFPQFQACDSEIWHFPNSKTCFVRHKKRPTKSFFDA